MLHQQELKMSVRKLSQLSVYIIPARLSQWRTMLLKEALFQKKNKGLIWKVRSIRFPKIKLKRGHAYCTFAAALNSFKTDSSCTWVCCARLDENRAKVMTGKFRNQLFESTETSAFNPHCRIKREEVLDCMYSRRTKFLDQFLVVQDTLLQERNKAWHPLLMSNQIQHSRVLFSFCSSGRPQVGLPPLLRKSSVHRWYPAWAFTVSGRAEGGVPILLIQ
jgi:hypothetical protein